MTAPIATDEFGGWHLESVSDEETAPFHPQIEPSRIQWAVHNSRKKTVVIGYSQVGIYAVRLQITDGEERRVPRKMRIERTNGISHLRTVTASEVEIVELIEAELRLEQMFGGNPYGEVACAIGNTHGSIERFTAHSGHGDGGVVGGESLAIGDYNAGSVESGGNEGTLHSYGECPLADGELKCIRSAQFGVEEESFLLPRNGYTHTMVSL